MRLVIADDEPLVRSFLRSLIAEASRADDGPPMEAKDGQELLDVVRDGRADAAFVDIRMPRMDGLEAMRILKKEGRGIPWFVLSSYSDFAYAKAALELGAAGYALKPPAPEEIAEALKTLRTAAERERSSRTETFERDWTFFAAGLADRPPELAGDEKAAIGLIAADPLPRPGERGKMAETVCAAVRERARRYPDTIAAAAAAGLRGSGRIAVIVAAKNGPDADGAARRFLNEAFMAAENALAEGNERRGRTVLAVDPPTKDLAQARIRLNELERTLGFRPLLPLGAIESRRIPEVLLGFSSAELTAAAAAAAISDSLADADRVALRKQTENLVSARKSGLLGEKAERSILRFLDATLPGLAGTDGIDSESLAEACDRLLAEGARAKPEGDTIAAVLDYVERHFQERITVASVARTFALTPNYLSALFHRRTGATFVERITDLRLTKARDLLRAGKRVKETAWAVGYGNERHFARLYRSKFGKAPAEERRAGQADS